MRERNAVKVACSVLRGGRNWKESPLPDTVEGWVMPLEERELHVAISEKETCPIHRDWHDEETDFKEKSVRYTEIRHTISHMKSRMWESRTSGSVRGVPCERYVYSTLVL